MLNRIIFLLLSISILSSCQDNSLFKEEPTTTDPVIRARELNDSAIDLVSENIKNSDAALAVFDASYQLDTLYDKPLINKIAVLMQLKRFQEAGEVADKLLSLRPIDADLHVLRGLLYRITGDDANASAFLGQGLQLYKNSLSNLDSNGPIYMAEKNKLALVYWILNQPEQTEQLAPGMTKEEKPTDEEIAAEFWKSLRPQ